MALQSSLNIGSILQQSFVQTALQGALRNFLSAQTTLTRQDFSSQRFRVESGLRSQLSTLDAVASVDTLQRAQFEVGRAALESVGDQFTQLTSLASSAVSASASDRATLQASANALLSSIRGTLSQATREDPNLLIRTTLPGSTLRSVQIDSTTVDIDSNGLVFDFDVVNSGERATRTSAINFGAGGGVATGASSFQITGNNGSAVVNVAIGESLGTVISRVNDLTESTGVLAVANGNTINLFSEEFGALQSITVTELTDAAGEVTGGTDSGVNATANVTVDGVVTAVTAVGRSFSLNNVGGVTGTVELIKDTTALTEGSNPASVSFTVFSGGKPLLNQNGAVISRQGFSVFDPGTLGVSKGGLDQIDLINDPSAALGIIAAAQNDLSSGISRLSSVSDGFLATRISAGADQIGAINTSLQELRTVSDALQLFERVRAEAQLNNSLAILSQLSQLFPLSSFQSA